MFMLTAQRACPAAPVLTLLSTQSCGRPHLGVHYASARCAGAARGEQLRGIVRAGPRPRCCVTGRKGESASGEREHRQAISAGYGGQEGARPGEGRRGGQETGKGQRRRKAARQRGRGRATQAGGARRGAGGLGKQIRGPRGRDSRGEGGGGGGGAWEGKAAVGRSADGLPDARRRCCQPGGGARAFRRTGWLARTEAAGHAAAGARRFRRSRSLGGVGRGGGGLGLLLLAAGAGAGCAGRGCRLLLAGAVSCWVGSRGASGCGGAGGAGSRHHQP